MYFNKNLAFRIVCAGAFDDIFCCRQLLQLFDVTVHTILEVCQLVIISIYATAYYSAPGEMVTIKILTPVGSGSDIRARYARARFQVVVNFKLTYRVSNRPKYTSSANGYGQVSGFCSVF